MNQTLNNTTKTPHPFGLTQVNHVVAIASGKGGVGKSTVATNLAVALQSLGFSVGLLDADIYGPSQDRLLGLTSKKPTVQQDKTKSSVEPISTNGLQVMSIACFTSSSTPVIWRGPMASSALQQMLFNTNWGPLDILLVDLPPGTGDIPLTLSQKVALSGALLVTTPHSLALSDVRRAVEMFNKVKVPILGLIENMAWHVCNHCHHKDRLWGQKSEIESFLTEYNLKCLGTLPLDPLISHGSDQGQPIAWNNPAADSAQLYKKIAELLWLELTESMMSIESPDIEMITS